MGLAVGASRFCTVPDEQLSLLAPGPVAAITQSGMLVQTLSRGLESAGLTLSHLISCGNQIGLTFADYIEALADDEALRVIICYVESVHNADRFFAAAQKAQAHGKSVVVVKIGGSTAAREAALAHTGSLAGSHAAFDARATLCEVAPKAVFTCKDADDQKFIDLAAAHRAQLLSKDKAVLCMARRLKTLGVAVSRSYVPCPL
jgi:succinyl-CoA synthetase alpha subunit